MSRSSVFLCSLLVGGCASAPPKAEVSLADVAGSYRGYMEPGVTDIEPVDQAIMKTVRFVTLTIEKDGRYKVAIDHEKRPEDNGKVLDEGSIRIEGKSLLFETKKSVNWEKAGEQSFTVYPGMKLDEIRAGKYEYVFKNGHRMIIFRA